MSRVEIALPAAFAFSTEIPLLMDHINAGGHFGNDAAVQLINEARARFLISRGLWEVDTRRGLAFVNADMAVSYRSEAFYGDTLRISVAAMAFHRCGFDLVYKTEERDSGRLVSLAKTAHLLISSETRRAVSEPEGYFDPLR